MKIGMVLEGGAMRGMYTAGVLDVFLDKDVKVDGIIGVSAGVLFGVNYCSKQRGRALRYNKRFCKDKNYMSLYSLIKTGNLVNKQFAFYDVPLIHDVFDTEEYKKSKTKFYATVTNVETGLAEYIVLDDIIEQMEVLRATGAMPYVSEMVEYDGKKYLDGALADSIPIDKCMEMGYDKIIVILTKPKNYRKKKRAAWIAKLVYGKYPKLVEAINTRYKQYNDTMEKLERLEEEGKIFVFRPSRKVNMSRVEKDPDKLQEMYDLGINDGEKLLDNLKSFLKK